MKRTTIFSGILRVICMVALILSFTEPVTADATTLTTLDIGGTTYTLGTDTLPTGLSWNAATNTLTLNNYTGTYIASTSATADLNLHLVGNNTLTGGYRIYEACIYAQGDTILISADKGAILKATATADPSVKVIYMYNGGAVNITGGDIQITANAGLGYNNCCDASSLNISGDANVAMTLDATNVADTWHMRGIWADVNISTSGNVSFRGIAGDANVDMIDGFVSVTPANGLKMSGTGSLYIETTGMASYSEPLYPNKNEDDYQIYGKDDGKIFSMTYKGTGTTVKTVSEQLILLTAPATGVYPQTTVSGEQFAGTVAWTDGTNTPTQFGALTAYTATVTLIPKNGYTFNGVSSNYFKATGASSVANTANSNVVTITYPATKGTPDQTFTKLDIAGVTVPKPGETPVTSVTETEEYTGSVSFSPNDSEFKYGMVYTATITLTPKEGYTNLGVTADAYTVPGATATNVAGSNVITAVFPATPNGQKLDIDGVTYWLSATISPQLPEGLSWDNQTRTLTLDNYAGSYIASTVTGIDLKLHLKGKNELSSISAYDAACIYANRGNVTISADPGAALKAVSTGTESAKTISVDNRMGNVYITGGDIELIAKHKGNYKEASCCHAYTLNISNDANVAMILDATGATNSYRMRGVYADLNVSANGNVSFKGIADETDELICGVYGNTSITGTGNVFIETTGTAMEYNPTYTIGNYITHGTYNGTKICISHKNCSYISVDEAVVPTCTAAGLAAGSHCVFCKEIFVAQTEGEAALGHDMRPEIEKATLDAAGKTYKKCSRCDEISDEIVIAKVADIALDVTSYVYDGTAKTPAVTVKDANGIAMKAGTDYTVAYTNNTNVGTARVIVTGKGNYEYTKVLSYTIKEKETNDGNTGGMPSEDVFEKELEEIAKEYGVSEDTLNITDETIAAQKDDKDIKGSSFGKLKAKVTKNNKTSVTLKWSKVKGADGYIIYGNRCNTKSKRYKCEPIKTLSANKTSYTAKKLKKGQYYKFIVRAYKNVNGKKVTIASSVTLHTITKGGKYGVAKSVKIEKVGSKKNATKIKLKKGKTATIKAKEIKESKPIKRHRKLVYESSNTKVATVSKSGKIKAKGKGKCKIYVYAQNGVYKTISVTVK